MRRRSFTMTGIYENGRCVLHSGPLDHVRRQLERFGLDEGQAEPQFVRGGVSSPVWPRQSRPRLRGRSSPLFGT